MVSVDVKQHWSLLTHWLLLLSWCLMSSDVIWHIRDKLWPMPKHGSIRKVYACLAVTCHLHFWQNDRDFLRATVVTRGWNGYRNKSQHRKSTLEKKILPPFQQGFEPATFQSRVRRSNHWAIPAPFTHWSQFVPDMSTRLPRTLSSTSSGLALYYARESPGSALSSKVPPLSSQAFRHLIKHGSVLICGFSLICF